MKSTRTASTLLAIILLIWLVNRTSANIRIKAVDPAKPALKATNQILSKINFPRRSGKSDLAENKKLAAKVKILEARFVRMKELSLENERLRGLLDFQKRIAYETIPVQIIGRDPSNWTNIIYIDKGRDQGVKLKMGVTADEGVVGRIIEASGSLAKVMLINDPDSRIAASVQRSREEGLVCGTLSRRCRMIYLSGNADVKIGDKVVTSDSGQTFAGGLLIGEIVDLFDDKGGLSKSAIIKPAADLRRLEEVLCIK